MMSVKITQIYNDREIVITAEDVEDTFLDKAVGKLNAALDVFEGKKDTGGLK